MVVVRPLPLLGWLLLGRRVMLLGGMPPLLLARPRRFVAWAPFWGV